MDCVHIYVLIDPRTDEIRYVGKTVRKLKTRLACHMCDKVDTKHKTRWINQLKSVGLSPIIQLIETCTEEIWQERERYWIKFHRENGCELTNSTDGGEDNVNFTEEVRDKLRNKAILERDMRSARTTKYNNIKVRCVDTEEVFDSLSILSSHLNMLPASVSRLIKHNIQIKGNTYVFINYKYDKTKHGKSIMRSDGKIYDSILSVANDMGINRKRIRDGISCDKVVSGFKYSYI